MNKDIERVLITREQIEEKVRELGAQITEDYAGKRPLMICLLKGSAIFFGDLVRAVDLPAELDFMAISSYGSGTKSSGEVRVTKDLDSSLEGKDVIIVEDIVDTGLTLNYIKSLLEKRNPASVKVCALLDKPSRREMEISADYLGFTIDNYFVVGYGLDYAQIYRNLPYIGILSPTVYAK